jgi:ABC-2 type transport system permease protein
MNTRSAPAPAIAEPRPAAAPPAPRTYGAVNWLGLWTLIVREVQRFWKVYFQTVFAPLVSTLLFVMVFALAMGSGVVSGQSGSIPYVEFVAPGLIMMAILNNAFANSSSSLIIAKVQGTTVDFLMPPLSALELLVAFIVGAALRGLVVGLASALAVVLMVDVVPQNWAATVYFAVMASVIFGAIGLLGGLWAEKFDHLQAVSNFVVTPLTFLSGTFYSIDRLPQPFKDISHWNPCFFLIDGFRYGITGYHDGPLVIGAVVSFVLTAVLLVACWLVIRSGYRLRA